MNGQTELVDDVQNLIYQMFDVSENSQFDGFGVRISERAFELYAVNYI